MLFLAISLEAQTYDALYNIAGTSVTPADGSSLQRSVNVGLTGNILGPTSTGEVDRQPFLPQEENQMRNATSFFMVLPAA